jgi:hypothetical protein
MTGFRIELRRGPGLIAAPLLLVIGLVAAREVVWSWSLWTDISQGIAATVRLMGPAAAAVAAGAALRSRRHGTEASERLAVRGPHAVVLAELGAMLAWVIAVFAALVALFLTVGLQRAAWGGPSIPWLLQTAAGLAAHVVVGYVAGRLVPMLLTPLAVGVATYLVGSMLLTKVDRWWYFLSLLNVQVWLPFDDLNNLALLAQGAWLVGVSALLVALAFRRAGGDRRPTAAFAAGGLALALTAALALRADPGGFWTLNTRTVFNCAGSAPQLCLHPAFESSRSALDARIRQVHDRLSGTPFSFDRVEHRPRGVGSKPSGPRAVAFGLDDPTQQNLSDSVVDVAANAFGANDACVLTSSPESVALQHVLVGWAAGSPVVFAPLEPSLEPSAEWFGGLPSAQQKQWLTAHRTAVSTCTLTTGDFR